MRVAARSSWHKLAALLLLALQVQLACGEASAADASSAVPVPALQPAAAPEGVDADTVTAILHQAEAMGMPTLAGATYFSGPFRISSGGQGVIRSSGLHARLADGTWLLDLIESVVGSAVDPATVAAMTIVDPHAPIAPPSRIQAHSYLLGLNLALIDARRIEAGCPGAGAILAHCYAPAATLAALAAEPALGQRQHAALVANGVRQLCMEWFLKRYRADGWNQHWAEAAAGIAPPGQARAILGRAERMHRAAIEPVAGDERIAPLRSWSLARSGEEPPREEDIADDVLIALAGDLRPLGAQGEAVGDYALRLLALRLGLDLRACFGHDPQSSWDDEERAAFARDIARWWQPGAGIPLGERVAAAAATMTATVLITGLLENEPWSGRMTKEEAVPPALAKVAARLLAVPPDDLPVAQLPGFLLRCAGEPAVAAAVAGWPRSGALRVLLADWEDLGGRHQALDELARAWAADPLADAVVQRASDALLPPFADAGSEPGEEPSVAVQALASTALAGPLRWWLMRPTPERWRQLRQWCAGDLDRGESERVVAACGLQCTLILDESTWNDERTALPLALPLAWLALHDQRPLSGALRERMERLRTAMSRELARLVANEDVVGEDHPPAPPPALSRAPLPADLRVGDLAALQLRIDRSWVVGDDHLGDALRAFDPCSPLADRNRLIAAACELIAAPICRMLEEHHLELPPGLEHQAGPALEGDEAVACRAVLAEAQRLGFPDLIGSEVATQVAEKNVNYAISGLHVRLADGSWLIDQCIPVAMDLIDGPVTSARPVLGETQLEIELLPQLPPVLRNRLSDGADLGQLLDAQHDCGLAALSWWLNGADASGAVLLSTLTIHAVVGCDSAAPLRLEPWDTSLRGWSYNGRRTPLAVEQGLRQLCSGWFRARLARASDPVEAARWAAAAVDILAPRDRPAIASLIARLQALAGLPRQGMETAPLAARLQAWDGDQVDGTTGAYREVAAVPCRRSETAELIALLDDDRPCRWWQGQWIPRRLGDNALRALCELWRFDWRELVVADATVAAQLGPPSAATDRTPWVDWRSRLWSDELRSAVVAALGRWWAAHGGEGPHAPFAAHLAAVPLSFWPRELEGALPGELDQQVGDALAGRITPAAISEGSGPFTGATAWTAFANAAVLFTSHAGISARLQALPPSHQLSALTAERQMAAGDATAFDALMTAALRDPDASLPGRYEEDFATAPLNNLGMWVYRPSPARLALLREALARPLTVPGTAMLIAHLGSGAFPLLGESTFPNAWSRNPGALAMAALLAADGLTDHRVLTDTELAKLALALSNEFLAGELKGCPGVRVCDWVANRLLDRRSERSAFALGGGWPDMPAALHQPVAARDNLIARLSAALAPIAIGLSEVAGLSPRRASTTSDF
jgi:hypothetical protein